MGAKMYVPFNNITDAAWASNIIGQQDEGKKRRV